MKKRLNQKGFTLVEVLATLVILVAIMGIAIPSISSSLERTKVKQNESRKRVLESAAELFVTDHKNTVYKNLNSDGKCWIDLNELDVSEDSKFDADGKEITGGIVFERPNTYVYEENNTYNLPHCSNLPKN